MAFLRVFMECRVGNRIPEKAGLSPQNLRCWQVCKHYSSYKCIHLHSPSFSFPLPGGPGRSRGRGRGRRHHHHGHHEHHHHHQHQHRGHMESDEHTSSSDSAKEETFTVKKMNQQPTVPTDKAYDPNRLASFIHIHLKDM